MTFRRDSSIERAARLLLGMVLLLGIAVWLACEVVACMALGAGR